MAKLKAFFLSIGFACAAAFLIFGVVWLVFWGLHISLSFEVAASVLLALIGSLCITFPAVGHVLVRRPKLTSGVLWVTSLIAGYFSTWLTIIIKQGVASLVSPTTRFSFGEAPLYWALLLLPLTFLLARVLLSCYFFILGRFGLLDVF